jgi:hypothetical protein
MSASPAPPTIEDMVAAVQSAVYLAQTVVDSWRDHPDIALALDRFAAARVREERIAAFEAIYGRIRTYIMGAESGGLEVRTREARDLLKALQDIESVFEPDLRSGETPWPLTPRRTPSGWTQNASAISSIAPIRPAGAFAKSAASSPMTGFS